MRISSLSGLVAIGALSLAFAGCEEPPPPAPFPIYVKVESDPGRPIIGAIVSRAGKELGRTGPDGRAMVKMPGIEGEIVDIGVTCPEGYAMPKAPLNVRLTQLADKTKVPEYGVSCPPNLRRVVIAVRAENGPFLPVNYLGKPITKTDESGAAHFALEVAPGAQFSVTLDTSERKDLKPPSPAKVFVVAQQDDILLYDQKFDVERKVVVAPKVYIPKALGPVHKDY
jgi:hypothetical protein